MLNWIKKNALDTTQIVNKAFDKAVKTTGAALDSETAQWLKDSTVSAMSTAGAIAKNMTDLIGDGKVDAEDLKLAAQKAGIAWVGQAAKVLTIGKKMKHNSMYQNNYQGQLDDVLIWNETLSAETIAQIASNNPSVGSHSLTINATDPAGNVGSASVDYSVQACK